VFTSLTPPGRPAHAFEYTPVDLDQSYAPPPVGSTPTQTRYSYNLDRQLTRVTRPDGSTVDLGYDTAGRLSTVTSPRGTSSYTYNATTGNLATITSPDNVTLGYAFDGSLLTETSWSGAVQGSVTRSYNNDFRITSRAVNGAAVAFSYDADGLLTQAGDLAIARNAASGFIDGTTLGSHVVTSMSYSGFGELAGATTTFDASGLYSTTYARDAGGRITQLD